MDVRAPPEVALPFGNKGKTMVAAKAPKPGDRTPAMDSINTRHELIKDANGSGFVIRITKFVGRVSRGIPANATLRFDI